MNDLVKRLEDGGDASDAAPERIDPAADHTVAGSADSRADPASSSSSHRMNHHVDDLYR